MPCVAWVFDSKTEKAHAIRSSGNDLVATALCGRELTYYSPFKGQEICTGCTSRDQDIHRHADHESSAPTPSRPERKRTPATRGGGL